jgi:hypothetical protein
MKKLFLLLAGVAVVGFIFAQGPITIKRASKAAKIDGVADSNDPWNAGGVTWINMTQNKGANTTSDITCKFQLTYDNSNLYLIAQSSGDKVMDTDAVAIPNSYERDCFEVFVKLDTTSGDAGTYIPGDFQFRQSRASIFPDRFDAGQLIAGWQDNGNFKIAQTEGSGNYQQEWQMPWSLLADSSGMDPEWDHIQIKFDIQNADNTTAAGNGRTQQLFWNSGSDEQWHNTTYFGLVTLQDKVVPVSVPTVKASAKNLYYNGIELKLSKAGNLVIYNVAGVKVASLKNVSSFNASSLTSGVYIAQSGRNVCKFVKR